MPVKDLCCLRLFVQYSQVQLNKGGESLNVEWATGEELAIHDSSGIAVSTANDTEVEVVVREAKGTPVAPDGGVLILTAPLTVEAEGLMLSEMTSDYTIPFLPGQVSVAVYTDTGQPYSATRVWFMLRRDEPAASG